jgi:hypothetical protein
MTNATTQPTKMTTETPELDLVDQMRRLSVGSDRSAFSFISEAPTVRSLDTDGSVDGGINVVSATPATHEAGMNTLVIRERAADPVIANSEDEATAAQNISSTDSPTSTVSPFWYQFAGFVPNASATFRSEFKRLGDNQAWSTETKRERKPEALTAEIAFHYGTSMTKLDRWQELCEDVGLEDIPTSITQCKKASTRIPGAGIRLTTSGSQTSAGKPLQPNRLLS